MNEKFIYLSCLPENIDGIPLSFVVPPKLTPTNSLGILSTEKYVPQNAPDIYTYSYAPSGVTVAAANASVVYPGTLWDSVTVGGISIPSGPLKIKDGKIQFTWLNSPISLLGIEKTATESFIPSISNGMVWRFYRVSENEPAWSWLIKAGLAPGDEVFLGYTVPEAYYDSINPSDLSRPETSRSILHSETVYPTTPTTIHFSHPISTLKSIDIGDETFTLNILPEQSYGIVTSIDNSTYTIKLNKSLEPSQKVTINYTRYAEYYKYYGHKYLDENDNIEWRHLDLNPQYGREVINQEGTSLPVSVALFQQVLLYLIPTCFCKLDLVPTGPPDGAIVTGTLTFDSAFNYGETHFVRHYVGQTSEVFDENLGNIDTDSYDYWGSAPLGQSYYDDIGSLGTTDDIFSTFLPSLMPIGKVLLAANDTSNVCEVIDIRQHGGGIPSNFSQLAVQLENKEQELSNLWDLGNWPGAIEYGGGAVKITIPATVLDTLTHEQVVETTKFYMPPGVDFEIEYT